MAWQSYSWYLWWTLWKIFQHLQCSTLLQQWSASPCGLRPILKLEVLPLQYQDNGENVLSIQKKRYGLNYLVLRVLCPPLICRFVTGNWTFTFIDQFFNMNATFLTLGKPVQFPVSCSLHTWQKGSLCLQLIPDHQKDKNCRWIMLSHVLQNMQKHEMLPPMTDCLFHHLKQSTYEAYWWSRSLEAMQDLGSVEGHG